MQLDRRHTKASLNASALWGRRHINDDGDAICYINVRSKAGSVFFFAHKTETDRSRDSKKNREVAKIQFTDKKYYKSTYTTTFYVIEAENNCIICVYFDRCSQAYQYY